MSGSYELLSAPKNAVFRYFFSVRDLVLPNGSLDLNSEKEILKYKSKS
jgi:hypothetical protein